MEYTKSSESPKSFHFWTGISTIAATLQRKVWIDERIFQWTPNFYIIFVGPPGVVAKSTTVRLGAKLLREVPDVKFGPNSLTWQSLTVALEEAQKGIPLTDQGIEGELLLMSCITCSIGELGTFLDPQDRKLVDVFTDLWDGQVGGWEHSTKTQGKTTIANPWLNVIGATTPSWLQQNFPESMIGGGLTSRIIFVYGDTKRSYVPYPHLVQTDKEHDRLEQDLIADLQQINTMLGEYKLTTEAIAWGAAWYEKHWEERAEHLKSDRFEGYLAREQTHMHKVAMVLAAAQRDKLVITMQDLQAADHVLTLAEHHMVKVFDSIGTSEENMVVKKLIYQLKAYGGELMQMELWRRVETSTSLKEFQEGINAAIHANYIQLRNNGSVTMVCLTKAGKQLNMKEVPVG